jgi:hypothetical protein
MVSAEASVQSLGLQGCSVHTSWYKSNKSFILCSFPDCDQRFSNLEERSLHIKSDHKSHVDSPPRKMQLKELINNADDTGGEGKEQVGETSFKLSDSVSNQLNGSETKRDVEQDSRVTSEVSSIEQLETSEKSAHDIAALALESLGKVRTNSVSISDSMYRPTIITTTSQFGSEHVSSPLLNGLPANSGAAIPGTDGEYQCYECKEKFANSGELRRHHKISHRRQTYKCRKCGQLFNSIADRQTHKNNKHFSTISCPVKSANFKEFAVGTVLTSERNEAGYFNCPSEYCTFLTRIPGYWYDHIHHVEHNGVNPQRKKRRQSSVYGMNAAAVST